MGERIRQPQMWGRVVGADFSEGTVEVEVKTPSDFRVVHAEVVIMDADDYRDLVQRIDDMKPRCHSVYIGEVSELKGLRCQLSEGHDSKRHFADADRYWFDAEGGTRGR